MLSKSVKYALKSLILISRSEIKNVNSISSELGIPKDFTSKILQKLSRLGYITSKMGRVGGFEKSDYDRSVKDLIIDIDGDFMHNDCVMGLSNCSDEMPCPLHIYFKEIKSKIVEMTDVSISDLCNDENAYLRLISE